MTLAEYVQSKLPDNLLGAELKLRPRTSSYVVVEVVGMKKPVILTPMELITANVDETDGSVPFAPMPRPAEPCGNPGCANCAVPS